LTSIVTGRLKVWPPIAWTVKVTSFFPSMSLGNLIFFWWFGMVVVRADAICTYALKSAVSSGAFTTLYFSKPQYEGENTNSGSS
jgi:hypothetical protein